MSYWNQDHAQVLSQISFNLLHSTACNPDQNLESKHQVFRLSSNSQSSYINFKQKTATTYFNTSADKTQPKSTVKKNMTWEPPLPHPKTFQSRNISYDQSPTVKKDPRSRRAGLVKMGNYTHKQSKQKFQFSRNKRRKSSVLNKENSSPQAVNKYFPKQRITTDCKPRSEPINLQHFEIGKRLGKGKFGDVYLVKEKRTNFMCAIKIIAKSVITKQFEQQLLRQIKIQMFFNHPNIVKMYGFFFDAKNIYILLEYCSSGTLYERMYQNPKLTQPEVSIISQQILTGLDELHYHRVLHRDIKPENILLEHGVVKIGDFGWSIHYHPSELRRTLCGTPLYLSPEVLIGEEYDEKVDIWSLGVITYQMLVCRNPFNIKSQSHLMRIVKEEPKFPESITISAKVKDFIEKMLAKEPKLRPQAKQLLNHPFVKEQ